MRLKVSYGERYFFIKLKKNKKVFRPWMAVFEKWPAYSRLYRKMFNKIYVADEDNFTRGDVTWLWYLE
jgi:hypothetical protein